LDPTPFPSGFEIMRWAEAAKAEAGVDEENGLAFVNSVCDKDTKKWACLKQRHVGRVNKSKLFKPAAH